MSFRERYFNRQMVLELGPVFIFFLVNIGWGLMAATVAVMAATAVCVVAGWTLERRVPVFGLVTVVLVLLLGTTALVLGDAVYVQIRPSIGDIMFALILAVGLLFRPSLLERALSSRIHMTEQGWRVLTWRWIGLAIVWAGANEIARRLLSVDDWVTFNLITTVATVVLYVVVTRLAAPRYWNGPIPD